MVSTHQQISTSDQYEETTSLKEGVDVEMGKSFDKKDYKPFDIRFMYYTTKNEHWINSPRYNVMKHFLDEENIG